jgi:hypothetical protein
MPGMSANAEIGSTPTGTEPTSNVHASSIFDWTVAAALNKILTEKVVWSSPRRRRDASASHRNSLAVTAESTSSNAAAHAASAFAADVVH